MRGRSATCTIGPIVKGIAKCTNTLIAAEVPMNTSSCEGDADMEDMVTPPHQRTLSSNVVPDYKFYSLSSLHDQEVVCALVEVKKEYYNHTGICLRQLVTISKIRLVWCGCLPLPLHLSQVRTQPATQTYISHL